MQTLQDMIDYIYDCLLACNSHTWWCWFNLYTSWLLGSCCSQCVHFHPCLTWAGGPGGDDFHHDIARDIGQQVEAMILEAQRWTARGFGNVGSNIQTYSIHIKVLLIWEVVSRLTIQCDILLCCIVLDISGHVIRLKVGSRLFLGRHVSRPTTSETAYYIIRLRPNPEHHGVLKCIEHVIRYPMPSSDMSWYVPASHDKSKGQARLRDKGWEGDLPQSADSLLL